ncbi:hypothetical protein HPP92_018984 [Vanilla planifolia]|uniref:C2 NT-type domain-containing protein n=1 Tax=Vanilla planifolia TaxID=51239 RepID=A0A835Q5Y5_VANPL|nr:hypothetical protein HPP92_019543 [Vanilla planifolia]KAG0464820.1 hypothetical protein HPP92_018984 [Vanilla planifolia]
MVARMIRWPWPPIISKKFEVRLVIRGIVDAVPFQRAANGEGKMTVEVRWKGPKLRALSSLRRTVKRNCTRLEEVNGEQGDVVWNEEFESLAGLTAHKENAFNPWVIEFVVFYGSKQFSKSKASILAVAFINLAEYASMAGEELAINLPLLKRSADANCQPILHLTLTLLEIRTCPECPELASRPVIPVNLPPSPGDAHEKDERSALRAGLRKVKLLTELVSTRKSKKMDREDEVSDGRCSAGSEDAGYTLDYYTESMDDNSDEELQEGEHETSIRKSFSYGTLATTNYVDSAFHYDIKFNQEYEDWVYYSHHKTDVGCSPVEESPSCVLGQSILYTTKRSILPWNKTKYSFRSPKAKGEPLLKKAYGEEGGDDIDYDRRQLSSSDESFSGLSRKSDDEGSATCSSVSEFGDDNFAIGRWEFKDVRSRDGQLKLSTEVFFASIDQRSERAAGQSACTALVAVIADWFKANQGMMPIKSQLDNLIREGSLEWRNLCENGTYMEQFPDKHFDLETILRAKIRPVSVVPGKSFVGFFHPEGCEDNRGFEFLHGAMSFDLMWDEITRDCSSECIYIVSWNDHFFVLKVEQDAYYIIDTLGERLYEGCTQAHILKFDDRTTIHRIPNSKQSPCGEKHGKQMPVVEEVLVCRGKESCKEYIKSFLAAVPIRELQSDIKKGFMASTPLHHRLQIEFHYTEASKEVDNFASFPSLPFWESTSQISWLAGPSPVRGPTIPQAAILVV